jgi:endonuclease/exonuclease/phosphatase family metal-dependent hydrolase
VAEIVTALSPQPLAILMGDMNAEPDSPEIQELTATFADAWEQGGVGADRSQQVVEVVGDATR